MPHVLATSFPLGSLVQPREERCFANERVNRRKRRYRKVFCGYIKVCAEENRERPMKKSRILLLDNTAIVIEYGGTERYPMLKLLTAAESGQWVGWVLLDDVELASAEKTAPQVPSNILEARE